MYFGDDLNSQSATDHGNCSYMLQNDVLGGRVWTGDQLPHGEGCGTYNIARDEYLDRTETAHEEYYISETPIVESTQLAYEPIYQQYYHV
jgi:hypothetical protein